MMDTLKDSVERRGPYAVWDLLDDEGKRAAALALWTNADRDERAALNLALAKELKFRPQAVGRLPAERVAGRLVRMAPSLPEGVLFQFLFHLHMEERRPLLVEFLDAAGVPHSEGVLELPEEYEGPAADKVAKAAEALVKAHGRPALVYLATLKVADPDLWVGADGVLEAHDAEGEARAAEPAKKTAAKAEKKVATEKKAAAKPAKKAASKKATPKKPAAKKPAAKKPAAKKPAKGA